MIASASRRVYYSRMAVAPPDPLRRIAAGAGGTLQTGTGYDADADGARAERACRLRRGFADVRLTMEVTNATLVAKGNSEEDVVL